MQTFLPYADFHMTAMCLDNKRLGKQRVEAYQILKVLAGYTTGWKNHPAVLMWQGHEQALIEYGREICTEWIRRGYNDTLLEKFNNNIKKSKKPTWLGNDAFHRAHMSNLLRKNPEHYKQFKWEVQDDLPYIWPVRKKSENKDLQKQKQK
jgi:hypothetical protein